MAKKHRNLLTDQLRQAIDDSGLTRYQIAKATGIDESALAKWFKHEARRVYAMLDESDAERDERRLVDWIGRKGGTVTPREVQQGCRWLKEPGAAETALEELAKAGHGIWEPSPAGRRGQPTRRFKLSTPSTVYGNHDLPEENSNTVDVDSVDAPDDETTASKGTDGLFGNPNPAGPYGDGF